MQEHKRKWLLLSVMAALGGVTGRAQADCGSDADCPASEYCAQNAWDAGGSNSGGSGGSTGATTGTSSTNTGGSSGTTGAGAAADEAQVFEPPVSECLPAPEYWCKSDAECAAGQRCEIVDRYGACTPAETACEADTDCAAGLACVLNSGGSTGGSDNSGGSSGSVSTGGSTGSSGASDAPIIAPPGSAICSSYPQPCTTSDDCDAGFACVTDASSGSGSTGGSDNGIAEPRVEYKQCEVKRLDCDSDADCSASWKCVTLSNQSGGLASPVSWGEAGAIKNCYPAGLAALAETVDGLPTARRIDARYPGTRGGDGGGGNSGWPCDGGSIGWDADAGTSDNNGSSGGGSGGTNGSNLGGGASSNGTGGSSNGTGGSSNGTGNTPHADDCSAAHGLSTASSSLIMLALGSLVFGRRRRRA